jgi:hypothetical protein
MFGREKVRSVINGFQKKKGLPFFGNDLIWRPEPNSYAPHREEALRPMERQVY